MSMKSFAGVILLACVCVGCDSAGSSSGDIDATTTSSEGCSAAEPENPYDDGTGHYAGFEWAERTDPGSCSGNSSSFIAGCEELLRQSAAYQACSATR